MYCIKYDNTNSVRVVRFIIIIIIIVYETFTLVFYYFFEIMIRKKVKWRAL